MVNHFPTLKPSHILDGNKENISFAFGMRILESDYQGPLITLRRELDDSELDFYATDKDVLDINAIITFASSMPLYVVTWYDQSGLGRNAVQTDPDKQPVFTPDLNFPHFNSDDTEDFLVVETNVQLLTNNGKNGTVIGVFLATDNDNHTFGVRDASVGTNRWLSHFNWVDDNLYFDPGNTATTRLVGNGTNLNVWKQYTLSRRDNTLTPNVDEIVFRVNSSRINNNPATQTYSDNNQLTGDYYFGIGATIKRTITSSNPRDIFNYSTTKFSEFIMYASGKEDTFIQQIEENQIIFWGL